MNEKAEELKINLQKTRAENAGQLRIKGTGLDKELISFIQTSGLNPVDGANQLGIKENQWQTWLARSREGKRKSQKLEFKELKLAEQEPAKNFRLLLEVSSVEDAAKLIRALC